MTKENEAKEKTLFQ